MASTYLSRSISSTGNRQTWTFSCWLKRNDTGNGYLFSANDASNYSTISFSGSALRYYDYWSGSVQVELKTNRVFRDPNAWFHIVVRYDTTQSTADDRIRFYVNGVQETSMATRTNPNTNHYSYFNNSGDTNYINREGAGGANVDCCMSHIHFTDGYSYAPTEFGSTDATTGEWKINTSPSVTYGTNGFFILKDGNSVTDQSGQSNNFTVSGTLTKTEDCPSNVFCTMNPLDNSIASSSFSGGNNTIETGTSNYTWNTGTLGMTSGKFYWEVKYGATSNNSMNYNLIGIADRPTTSNTAFLGSSSSIANYAYYSDNGHKYFKGSSGSYGASYSAGDIIGVAVDLDNSKLYFSKNGTWQNSGVPTSGSTGTGAISIDAVSSTTNGVYFPASGDYGSTQYVTNYHNFGNGYFGTSQVASAGTNASNNGIFEYDVPTGYTALSTKGLNL
tara:strand:+ start:116 stop:1453 length:1338 start_codon:yes stop_codon:yes gene_type:complete